MRLALLFLALAAALSWGGLHLRAASDHAQPIVTAQRSGGTEQAPTPDAAAPSTPAPSADTGFAEPPPLFRPAQAPSENVGPAPGESFVLIGLAGQRENRLAFVRDLADQQTFRVRVGDSVSAWVVEEIEDTCVALRRGRHTQRVCL